MTFVDVPGFLPGTAQEHNGIIKHGAKLLFAYAEATVPKITVITRKAYGGAYDVMASKHLRGDLNYAWPTAEIAVMGPRARSRSSSVGERPRRSPSGRPNMRHASPSVRRGEQGFRRRGDPAALDRRRIALGLRKLRNKDLANPWKKHDNLPLERGASWEALPHPLRLREGRARGPHSLQASPLPQQGRGTAGAFHTRTHWSAHDHSIRLGSPCRQGGEGPRSRLADAGGDHGQAALHRRGCARGPRPAGLRAVHARRARQHVCGAPWTIRQYAGFSTA